MNFVLIFLYVLSLVSCLPLPEIQWPEKNQEKMLLVRVYRVQTQSTARSGGVPKIHAVLFFSYTVAV